MNICVMPVSIIYPFRILAQDCSEVWPFSDLRTRLFSCIVHFYMLAQGCMTISDLSTRLWILEVWSLSTFYHRTVQWYDHLRILPQDCLEVWSFTDLTTRLFRGINLSWFYDEIILWYDPLQALAQNVWKMSSCPGLGTRPCKEISCRNLDTRPF